VLTHTALETLFADNTTGDISPADIRAYLDSILVPWVYGGTIGLRQATIALVAGSYVHLPVLFDQSIRFNSYSYPRLDSTTGAVTIDSNGLYLVLWTGKLYGTTSLRLRFANVDGTTGIESYVGSAGSLTCLVGLATLTTTGDPYYLEVKGGATSTGYLTGSRLCVWRIL
jgi:hypothetical protein